MSKTFSAGPNSWRRRRAAGLAIVAATIVTGISGCRSDKGSDAKNANATAGAKVGEAQSFVAKYEAPLTSFYLPPLKSAPPRGKKIAVVVNNVPESHVILDGAQEAAKTLGWTAIPIIYDPSTPTGLQDAFAQAAADNPDGVVTQAADTSAYAQAAQQFVAKNIPVVTSNTTDEIKKPIIANVTDPDQVALAGRITANYVVAQKGDKADVAMFNIPSFSILAVYENAFKAEYARLCPACKYKSIAVQAADIGTKVPAQVVSAVQADPKINVAVMGFGTVALGVSGALRTAGITGVKIVGEAPAIGNVAGLINGSEDMWVAFPLRGIGWKSVDALARYFTNEPTDVASTAQTPFQIMTKANAGSTAALPEVANYQAQFAQLWHVG